MKIIHCADLHLNSKMETHFDLAKSVSRKKEILATFVKMVEYAHQNQVEVVIFAGDTFDNSKITKETLEVFLSTINNHQDIIFLYLSGNHDEKVVFPDEVPNNLKFFNNYWTKYTFGKVVFSGIELDSSNYILASKDLELNSDNVNIVIMHGQVVNSKPQSFDEINLKEYKDKNIDYLALGHIHSYRLETLDNRGVMCYSGSLEGRGFDELGEKGFSLIEIKNKKVSVEFIPFSSRVIEIIKIDITDINTQFELQNKIDKVLKEISKNNIIRIELTGQISPTFNKSIELLEEEFNKDFYYVKISDKQLKVKIKDIDTNSVSLISEFSKLVLNSNMTEEEKEYVVSLGFKALNGEDIEI